MPQKPRPHRLQVKFDDEEFEALVAELLGDSKRVAADHYVYALVDYAEVDRRPALRRPFA